MYRTTILAVALILGASSPLWAQDIYCNQAGKQEYDADATQAFADLAGRGDQAAMQAMSGVWYAEIANPAGNQINYEYQMYEPDGQFQYQQRICGGLSGGCNDYQGIGYWAAMDMGNGGITVMTIVSDLTRDHQCGGTTVRMMGADSFQTNTGTVYQRTQ